MTNLLFDYDGTLHNCIKIYTPSFILAYNHLITSGYAKEKSFTDKEISKWLGYSSIDMWNLFMPSLPQNIKEECSKIIGNEMVNLVKKGKAQLYPAVTDTLSKLKQDGYNLIFLSNCKESYMNIHKEQFKLDKYFSEFYCTEAFSFKPKYEIFNCIKANHMGNWVVIGDRFHDMEIAEKHSLISIGCAYGYGSSEELKNASCIANTPYEIYDKIKNLT